MLRHALSLAVPLSLISLLVACGNGETVEAPARPAMVVQPLPAADAVDTYPGEVRARFEPELAFRIGGKIAKRLVDAGDRVRKDQPLAELDPQDVKLQLEAARAQLNAAEANLKLVRSERDRYKTLLARQLISQSQYDTVENQYRAGEARVKQIKAEFDVASNQAGYSVLRASQDGLIARRLGEVGQVVAAGQTVFTLAADGEREVLISVPEHALERFRIGQEVSIELWSQPDKQFPGRIRELSPAADAQSRTFAARVTFSDPKVKAEVGQSARVSITADGEVPLSVPLSALSAEKGKPFVWVIDAKESKVVRTPVRVGSYGQERVSILEGLKEGDWVVAAGVHVLLDGQKVRPVDRDNRVVALVGKE
ncbi:membrane fusion protein, multidrug efflux system [Aquipseudomonas alcaligenes]|uniref:Membrane fusion protein, multidrug efflux system n=1 Tax=Aquipseudomonas alcaligenes TaxID=43263 RepID=A0A1N6QJF7_AQUAC|nr:efflux RND transporter periplasmic adaptor subunit [Pseudomonas alcaligenes]SIQ16773.1 membrane fusion protein, multidrug efflux system [Pseudomonas alcaligenes]SIR97389.1 membrane fusion protein, multidrug efflux system [Pseudomonas alcaligenes]